MSMEALVGPLGLATNRSSAVQWDSRSESAGSFVSDAAFCAESANLGPGENSNSDTFTCHSAAALSVDHAPTPGPDGSDDYPAHLEEQLVWWRRQLDILAE